MMKPWIVFIAVFALTGAAQAQINKCVDAAGKTVYSQAPCPKGVKASKVDTTPSVAGVAASAKSGDAAKAGDAAKTDGPKTAADLEQDFRKRQQEQADVRKKEEQRLTQVKNDQENCDSARRQLSGLELGGRQARIDEKGERVIMEDAQVEQEKQRARQSVASSCK